MTPELAGNVGAAVVIVLLALTVIFSIWAWKLWHGEWLNSIAGNTFASKKELGLPYQKRMAKEVAVLLLVCDLMFAALILCELCSAGAKAMLLVVIAFGVVIVAGGIVITLGANKAAKDEQAKAGSRVQGWPTKDPEKEFTARQWIFFALLYVMTIPFVYFVTTRFGG